MRGKDIKVGMEVAFHPERQPNAQYVKPYRGKITKIIAKGDTYETEVYARWKGTKSVQTVTADQSLYEVEVLGLGSGSWSISRVGEVIRVRSAKIWRPWDEEKTRQEREAKAKADAERRRLASWEAYDAMIADIQADLGMFGLELPENVLRRHDYDRRYRSAPTKIELPLEFVATIAGAIG